MKKVLFATLSVFALTSAANAFELGGGLAAGGEVESSYNFGTEDFSVLFTPEVSFATSGLFVGASLEIDMLDLENYDFTGVDFEATYTIDGVVPGFAVEAFGEISTDADFEFGDLVVGTRLNF